MAWFPGHLVSDIFLTTTHIVMLYTPSIEGLHEWRTSESKCCNTYEHVSIYLLYFKITHERHERVGL